MASDAYCVMYTLFDEWYEFMKHCHNSPGKMVQIATLPEEIISKYTSGNSLLYVCWNPNFQLPINICFCNIPNLKKKYVYIVVNVCSFSHFTTRSFFVKFCIIKGILQLINAIQYKVQLCKNVRKINL